MFFDIILKMFKCMKIKVKFTFNVLKISDMPGAQDSIRFYRLS